MGQDSVTTTIILDLASVGVLAVRERAPKAAKKARSKGQRSLIIREILRRYDEICRVEAKSLKLSTPDWDMLYRAGERGSQAGVMGLLEGVRRQDGGEKLVRRLLSFSTAQQIAVLDTVEQHWVRLERDRDATTVTRRSNYG